MNQLRVFLVIGIALIFASSLKAQYIIEQIEYGIPINYELLPEGTDFDAPFEEAKFFLNLPESKLKASAYNEDEEIEIQKSTIYISGDNFAVESQTKEDGKITVISNYNKGMLYYVLWSQKKVYEMSKKDMEDIQAEAYTAVKKMMEQLPPEMRQQARLAMEEKKDPHESNQHLISTGKTMTKYGHKCKQYMIEGDNEVMIIWASDDRIGLAKKAKAVSEKLSKIFPSMDEEKKDEWELVSGKIPIEVRTYQMNPMAGARIEIQAITKINETKPPAKKFIPPGEADGFTKSSFKEMMNQMMQGKGDY